MELAGTSAKYAGLSAARAGEVRMPVMEQAVAESARSLVSFIINVLPPMIEKFSS